jgi:hypothetical protein
VDAGCPGRRGLIRIRVDDEMLVAALPDAGLTLWRAQVDMAVRPARRGKRGSISPARSTRPSGRACTTLPAATLLNDWWWRLLCPRACAKNRDERRGGCRRRKPMVHPISLEKLVDRSGSRPSRPANY